MSWRIKLRSFTYFAAVTGVAAVLISCKMETEPASALQANTYPNLPEFFQQEIDSLEQTDPLVTKTVRKDDQEEQRELHIKNWNTELASFRMVDLNKPAYAGSIQADTTADGKLQFRITDPKADLSYVSIGFDSAGDLEMISIERDVENSLYHTVELLVYEKGRSYLVEKKQKVLLLGDNFYKVEGQFTSPK